MHPEADTRVLAGARPESADSPTPRALAREQRAGDPLLLHRWVGRYELIHRLAHGGMATVYLGRAKGQAGFEKVVAVKVIHPHLASEAEFVGMFLDEARIAARIHHPHVVEILDLGEAEGGYYMVMEFIEGENLAALVRALGERKRLPIAVILQIVADTLEGLAAAHDLRDPHGKPYHLVHRDVSPHNILINLDGWAKVGDFGIMKAAGKASSTKTGELRGKLAYMSPEQARGGVIDHRADLFAVGVIAWELLSGQRLFACASEAATLEKLMRCEVPQLDPVGHERPELAQQPELSRSLDAFVRKALTKAPGDRWDSATAMLAELRRLQRSALDLEEGRDPRAHLGGLMARHFQTRVDYARAALRRTGEHEALIHSYPDLRPSESGVLPARDRTPAASRPASGSNPLVGFEATPTPLPNTSPSTIVQKAPNQRWLQWLVLPMLGAGIAVIAMLMIAPGERELGGPDAPARPAEPTHKAAPREVSSTEYQLPPRRVPEDHVRWCFSTTPAGASVSVGGVPQSAVTPSCVVVPAGDDPVSVELSLPGYELLRLDLTPVADQNFPERLTAIAAGGDAKPKQPRERKRSGKADDIKTETKPNKDFIPVPESLRGQ